MNQPVLDQDLVDLIVAIATEKNLEAKDVTLSAILESTHAISISPECHEALVELQETSGNGWHLPALLVDMFMQDEKSVKALLKKAAVTPPIPPSEEKAPDA